MVPEETPVDDSAVSVVDPGTEVDAANATTRRQKHRRRVVTEWLIIIVVALAV